MRIPSSDIRVLRMMARWHGMPQTTDCDRKAHVAAPGRTKGREPRAAPVKTVPQKAMFFFTVPRWADRLPAIRTINVGSEHYYRDADDADMDAGGTRRGEDWTESWFLLCTAPASREGTGRYQKSEIATSRWVISRRTISAIVGRWRPHVRHSSCQMRSRGRAKLTPHLPNTRPPTKSAESVPTATTD